MRLTEEQQRPVRHEKGHALVVAVAGSGKTTMLVARIMHLITHKGADPRRIMVVMFNTAARDSFKERLGRALPNVKKEDLPRVLTFHGCGTQLIRRLTPRFLPDDYQFKGGEWQEKKAAKEALERLLGERNRAVYRYLDDFVSFIDLVKSTTQAAAVVFNEHRMPAENKLFIAAFDIFENKRKEARQRYFSDLIYDPVMALVDNESARRTVAGQVDYLIVDEYQDINESQQEMIKAVAGNTAEVMAVGDPDQCIYTWRGARPDYILKHFYTDFPGTQLYQLTRTFRYGHALSLAANFVITNNTERVDQLCISGSEGVVTELSLDEDGMEVSKVPELVNEWCEASSDHKRSDIAVLVRTFTHAIPVELAMLNAGIPYRLEGRDPVLVRGDMAGILCAMKIAGGILFNTPRVDAQLVSSFLRVPPMGLSFEDEKVLIDEMQQDPSRAVSVLDSARARAPASWMRSMMEERATAWRSLERMGLGSSPSAIVEQYFEAVGMERYFEREGFSQEQIDERMFLFETFMRYAEIKESAGLDLLGFLGHVDDMISASKDLSKTDDPVLVTSCHRSKGLEWDMVIMAGLSDGRFPFIPSDGDVSIEDERRLFYVAMTRARKRLCLLVPNDHKLRSWLGNARIGHPDGILPAPEVASRFVYESNLFLSQLAPQFVSKGGLPANIKQAEGAALSSRYLTQLSPKE